MVVYYCGSLIRCADIPHALWEDVDACIAAGDEILVGNDGFGHRVYGRCKSRQYENAEVYKTKLGCEKIPVNCDRMVAVWDGESHEVLVNILLLLALQKKCRLYFLPYDLCIEISSVDELEPLVPDREGWTPQLVRKILKACGFGKEMLDHMLESGIPSESVLTDIVCRAPVPLKKKHEMLDLLIKKTNVNYETLVKGAAAIREGSEYERVEKAVSEVSGVFGDSLHDAVRELSLAEMGLKHCMYYLFDEWYDPYVLIVKSYPCGLFGTLKQVKRYIKKAVEFERELTVEDEGTNRGWYRIEAWDLNGWDKYELGFNYYVYNGEICWFERMETIWEVNGLEYYVPADERFYRGVFDLSVPTPFKAGDIVNIDCSPFGPPFRALVVEGVEQYDCCFPTILFKVPFTDNWRITALKHKRFYKNADVGMYEYEPRLSPLYRLRSALESELGDDDLLLVKVSKWIGGDEDRGAAFWNVWHECHGDEMTAEEVEEILRLSASIGE